MTSDTLPRRTCKSAVLLAVKQSEDALPLTELAEQIYPQAQGDKDGCKFYQQVRRAVRDLRPIVKEKRRDGLIWVYPGPVLRDAGRVDLIQHQHSSNMAQIGSTAEIREATIGAEEFEYRAANHIRNIKSEALSILWDEEILNEEDGGGLDLDALMRLEKLFYDYLDEADDRKMVFLNDQWREGMDENERYKVLDYLTRFNSEDRRKAILARYHEAWRHVTTENTQNLRRAERTAEEVAAGRQDTLTDRELPYHTMEKHKTEANSPNPRDISDSAAVASHFDDAESEAEEKFLQGQLAQIDRERDEEVLVRSEPPYRRGVVLTLTTDPSQYSSVMAMVKDISGSWNRFKQWLSKRLDVSPEYIKVLEFTSDGKPHLHICIFGTDWLAAKAVISHYWQRTGQGKVTHLYRIYNHEGTWYWKDDRPEDTQKKPMDYLKKEFMKAWSNNFALAIYWATQRRFFTTSHKEVTCSECGWTRHVPIYTPALCEDCRQLGDEEDLPGVMRQDILLSSRDWRYMGTYLVEDIPSAIGAAYDPPPDSEGTMPPPEEQMATLKDHIPGFGED